MADPQTRQIGGDGTGTLTYPLAPGVFQYIQSVLIEVDNGAGPDTRPVLSVQTHDGVAVADKTQGSVIPAGDTGRATWALRLTDETAGGGGGFVPTDTNSSNLYDGSANVPAGGVQLPWNDGGGAALLDLTNPLAPTVNVAGVYALTIGIDGAAQPIGAAARLELVLPGGAWSFSRVVWLPVQDPNDTFRFYETSVTDYFGLTDTIVLAASYPLLVGTSPLRHRTTVQRIT